MNNLQEKKGAGAISINPIYRWYHQTFKRRHVSKTVSGMPFNWTTGYDVRNTIGPITIKNQGTNDSCGGQAGSYAMEISRCLQGITDGQISAKSIYSPIAYPGGGTTVPALTTQFCTKGGNLETAVPSYDAVGNPLSELLMEDLSWQTPSTVADAFKRAGYTPLNVNIDINSIAQAIQAYGFVIWEIRGQVNGTWASAFPVPPQKGATGEFFAHFMCGIGGQYANSQNELIFLESEGTVQGEAGIQFFHQDYVDSGYIVDCFTFIPDGMIASLPPTMGIWQSLLAWFKSMVQLNKVQITN